jgi:predicted acetyltransferase
MASGKIDSVTLTATPAAGRQTIANLLQLYLHDFSEFAVVGTPHGEVDALGRFAYAGIDGYWRDEGRAALTIEADGRLAGFALVNRWSALNRPLDHSVAEFLVLRKYRRAGVGLRAAKLLFARLPGRWEAAVAWYNAPALSFWRHAVAACADGIIEECAGDGERWSGPVLCFAAGAPTPLRRSDSRSPPPSG